MLVDPDEPRLCNEIYVVLLAGETEHFVSYGDTKEYSRRVIADLYGDDEYTIDFVFSDVFEVMDIVVNGDSMGQIYREFLNWSVESALTAYHNDD